MDISDTIAPKSDQLNAEDLLSGERTFTIAEVRVLDAPEQPVHVYLAEFPPDRPWKPSKTSRRVMLMAWGNKSADYAGHRITLYRDPEIKFGGDKVGGIKIRAMSHLPGNKRMAVALTVTRGKRAPYVVEPLPDVPAPADPHQERIDGWLAAYASGGITHAMLEAHQGRAVSEWDEGNVANLAELFEALKSGEKKKADEFPELDAAAETSADA